MVHFFRFFMVIMLIACCGAAAQAESKQIAAFKKWTLHEDGDPIFGVLGYDLVLPSKSDDGASDITYQCTYSEGGESTLAFRILFHTSLFPLPGAPSNGTVTSLIRFAGEDVYEASWAPREGADGISFSNKNRPPDDDQDEYVQEMIDAHNAGTLGSDPLGDALDSIGIGRLAWNLKRHETLALGFEVGSKRISVEFDLAGSEPALTAFFSKCASGGKPPAETKVVSLEQAQIDARDEARWEQQRLNVGEVMQYQVGAYCIEIGWGEKPHGVPIVVDIDRTGAKTERKKFLGESLVLQGPIQSLKVRIGEDTLNGVIGLRSWDALGIPCAGL